MIRNSQRESSIKDETWAKLSSLKSALTDSHAHATMRYEPVDERTAPMLSVSEPVTTKGIGYVTRSGEDCCMVLFKDQTGNWGARMAAQRVYFDPSTGHPTFSATTKFFHRQRGSIGTSHEIDKRAVWIFSWTCRDERWFKVFPVGVRTLVNIKDVINVPGNHSYTFDVLGAGDAFTPRTHKNNREETDTMSESTAVNETIVDAEFTGVDPTDPWEIVREVHAAIRKINALKKDLGDHVRLRIDADNNLNLDVTFK